MPALLKLMVNPVVVEVAKTSTAFVAARAFAGIKNTAGAIDLAKVKSNLP